MHPVQDWTTVYFHKPHHKKTVNAAVRDGDVVDTVKKVATKTQEYSNRARKLEADCLTPATEEAPKNAALLQLSHTSRQTLIKARVDKQMTQQQLAQRCNLPPIVIKTLEGGGVVQERKVIDKVNRVLGTTLRFEQ